MTTGSDFSGVGAFDQALKRMGIEQEKVYACDWDKYSRISYIHNYGEPKYYPEDVYDREIPEEPLDIYMTSPPCQSFSLAGKRGGEDDDRGLLFYNSHEFIQKNKPRYFIFENVKGLLSDDGGKTFQRWLDMLGGKSVNGNPLIFPHPDSVPYHIYWKVLNAKDYGIPQNRERVFIIGIRDDADNQFKFPKPIHLEKRLKDVLEEEVDEKYFLSDSAIKSIILNDDNLQKSKVDPEIASALQTPGHSCGIYKGMNAISVKSTTNKGYEVAEEWDSIYLGHPNSETRRGRVGNGLAQTIDVGSNQGVFIYGYTRDEKGKVVKRNRLEYSNTIHTATGGGGNTDQFASVNSRIRRLTPRECFKLMDFPDDYEIVVSDTQAYKQAGNSICVGVLVAILEKLLKC